MQTPSDFNPPPVRHLVPAQVPSSPRLFSLDVLRGIAILGMLIIGIWEFGGFSVNEQIRFRTGTHGGNYLLMNLVSILSEGKMRALFALVMGAGIVLYLSRRDHPSGLSVPDLYIRRKLWLAIFGIFNAIILLYPGEIFFQIAILSILLFPFWRMKPRGLFIAALITILIFCGKNYWNYTDQKKSYRKFIAIESAEKKFSADSLTRARLDSIWVLNNKDSADAHRKDTTRKLLNDSLAAVAKKDTLTSDQQKDKGEWEGLVRQHKFDSSAGAADNKTFRDRYTQLWNSLLHRSQGREAEWLYKTGIWDLGSMMLLGMALVGIGFFHHRLSTSRYWLIAATGLLLGLLLAWWRMYMMDTKFAAFDKYVSSQTLPADQFFPIERLLLATAYASLILIMIKGRLLNWFWKAFAAVGQMALTNYLFQSIICTLFFYGYGRGNFGRLTQWELYAFAGQVWIIQIVFSIFWLRSFHRGPVEWLLARLVYGRWLPNRKEIKSALD